MLRQVRNGDHFEVVLQAEMYELRHARHTAIVVHDFADHSGWMQASQAGKINGRLRLASAFQHSTGARTKWKHVTRASQFLRTRGGIDRCQNSLRAVVGRNAGCDTAPSCIDGDGEGRPT